MPTDNPVGLLRAREERVVDHTATDLDGALERVMRAHDTHQAMHHRHVRA